MRTPGAEEILKHLQTEDLSLLPEEGKHAIRVIEDLLKKDIGASASVWRILDQLQSKETFVWRVLDQLSKKEQDTEVWQTAYQTSQPEQDTEVWQLSRPLSPTGTEPEEWRVTRRPSEKEKDTEVWQVNRLLTEDDPEQWRVVRRSSEKEQDTEVWQVHRPNSSSEEWRVVCRPLEAAEDLEVWQVKMGSDAEECRIVRRPWRWDLELWRVICQIMKLDEPTRRILVRVLEEKGALHDLLGDLENMTGKLKRSVEGLSTLSAISDDNSSNLHSDDVASSTEN